jgi:hypothetical protein
LDAITNLSLQENAGAQTVTLTGISAGSGTTVAISAVSSAPNIISTPLVSYTAPSNTGTLTFTPVANASGSATVTVTVNNGDATNNLASETFTVTVVPTPVANPTPSLDALTNLTIYANSGPQIVPLSGIRSGMASGYLAITIWAYSSDSSILPDPAVDYTSPNDSGTLTLTPVTNALGMATVEVKVNNGMANISQSFAVTVVPPPANLQPPTLDAITNLSLQENAGAQTVTLTGISAGSGTTVAISAVSSAPNIIPTPLVSYTAPSSTGTLTFTPAPNASGSATVTVTVNNGDATNNLASETFTVTVVPTPVANPMPALDALTNLTIYENSGPQVVPLSGIRSGIASGYQAISIWAYSSDTAILPDPVVDYTSPNDSGTLTLTPATNALGTATVEVKVNNGLANVTQSFAVTLVPLPANLQLPTLDALTNLSIQGNDGAQTVALTGISPGSGTTVTISAVSSDPAIIPTPIVSYSNPNSVGSLTFTPAKNVNGIATITLIIANNLPISNQITASFSVNVSRPSIVSAPPLPPTMNPIPNIDLIAGTSLQTIPLTGITLGSTAMPQLARITATSSNSGLVSPAAVSFNASQSNAWLTLRLPPIKTGVSTITVTLNNGGKNNNLVRQSFTVTVSPPAAPTLDPISCLTVSENAGAKTIVLTGIRGGSASANPTLKVSAASSASALSPKVQYTSPGNTAWLTFEPRPHFVGTAVVTVTVSDGSPLNGSVRREFVVKVTPESTQSSPAQNSGSGDTSVVPSNMAALLTPLPSVQGEFDFQVSGLAGGKYVVQATSDLVHWTSLQTNTAPFVFRDPNAGVARRFYRANYQP